MPKKVTPPANQEAPEKLPTRAEKEKLRRPIGLYLRRDERSEVEEIAKKEGLSRHAILSYGISYFLKQYRAGKVQIEKETTVTLKRG